MRRKIILMATLILLSIYAYAGFTGWEAEDKKNDTDCKDVDLVYSCVWIDKNESHFEIKVAGEIKKSLYCEFDIYGEEGIKKLYFNGGRIFLYNEKDEGGELQNASYSIKKNTLEIILPWEINDINNLSVNVDIMMNGEWHFDKIPSEQFHFIKEKKNTEEKEKKTTISFSSSYVILALLIYALFRLRDLL